MWSKLPIELCHRIVFYATSKDQLTLLITSHGLRCIAIREYYRDLTFEPPKQIKYGFRILSNNREAADAVRSFTVNLRYVKSIQKILLSAELRCREIQKIAPAMLAALRDLIYTHLKLLINVKELQYQIETGTMPDCLFPRLRSFTYRPVYLASTAKFLSKHPSIEKLQLLTSENQVRAMGRLPFFHLKSYNGPGRILEVLGLGACLGDAQIRWPVDADVSDYDLALKALAPSTNHIRRLSCAQAMPDTRVQSPVPSYTHRNVSLFFLNRLGIISVAQCKEYSTLDHLTTDMQFATNPEGLACILIMVILREFTVSSLGFLPSRKRND